MRVLIIDDEESIRRTTKVVLEGMRHETTTAATSREAMAAIDKTHFDVAFLDLKLGETDGLVLLPELLRAAPHLDVIVFTAFASVETAVEAMKAGATDYIPKPFTPDQIRQTLRKVAKTRRLEGRLAELEARLSASFPSTDLSTEEPALQRVLELAFKTADTPATILITGESGTGKSVIARAIHETSPQKENSFVTVNCPSLSRDLIESELFGHVKGAFTGAINETWGKISEAEGGTLFLDEIGELPPEIQPKLLRLLQDKEYERVGEAKTRRANVRIISATNRDLEKMVEEGTFREDLYYRLNVITLSLPPLRQRRNDLIRLAEQYRRFFAEQCGKEVCRFSPTVVRALTNYDWPGNLRELRNVVERAIILSGDQQIELMDLPDKLKPEAGTDAGDVPRLGAKISLAELEREHIRQVLRQVETLEEGAQILGIDPATLYRKRKKLNI